MNKGNIKVGILFAILLCVTLSWNVAAQEEVIDADINVNIGVVYSSLQWKNISDSHDASFLSNKLGGGVDFEIDVNLTSWFTLSAEIGLYGYYNFANNSDLTLEFPVRLGPKFSFAFLNFKPYIGWLPVKFSIEKYRFWSLENLLHKLEIGAAIGIGPVTFFGGYVLDFDELFSGGSTLTLGVVEGGRWGHGKYNIHNRISHDGYFRMGVRVNLFSRNFL